MLNLVCPSLRGVENAEAIHNNQKKRLHLVIARICVANPWQSIAYQPLAFAIFGKM